MAFRSRVGKWSNVVSSVARKAGREHAFAKHTAPLVERDEGHLRKSVYLSQRLAQSLERGVRTG
jgi:hypothetical protein